MPLFSRYRLIPIPADVVELTERNIEKVAKWCGSDMIHETNPRQGSGVMPRLFIMVPTQSGPVVAMVGSFVVRSMGGGFEVLSRRQFEASYERASD